MSGQSGWYHDGQHLNYLQQGRVRTRPDGYVPFQSILYTDGRFAYQPGAQQYPMFDHPAVQFERNRDYRGSYWGSQSSLGGGYCGTRPSSLAYSPQYYYTWDLPMRR